jgi:hypothetical protein
MFRSLARCLALVLLVALRSVPVSAEEPACRDLASCAAVRDLADQLKIEPPRTKPGTASPVPPGGGSPVVTPRPRPAAAVEPVAAPVKPAPAQRTCSAAERRAAPGWTTLKPMVVQASKAAVEITRCKKCDAAAVDDVQDVWGRSMVRYVRILSCALGDAAEDSKRSEVVEELRRVFSGAMVAGAGDATAVLALMQNEKLQGATSLSDVLELYDRLKDPKTRAALVARLRDLGEGGSALSKGLEHLPAGEKLQQNLLDMLLNAERASLSMGMAFVSEGDVRGRRARGVRGLQLLIEQDWDGGGTKPASALGIAARDYVQGFKELLTVLTAEGIRPEKTAYGEDAAKAAACACRDDLACETLLWVRLEPKGENLEPRASLEFRDSLERRCSNASAQPASATSSAPKTSETIAGEPLRVVCEAPKTDAQCANDRLSAASTLLERLSHKFSIFGDVAFLPTDRKVETISQTFHEGVSIDEMRSPNPERAPDLLQRGLTIANDGCASVLTATLTLRLEKTYALQIGEPIGKGGRATLRLTSESPNSCTLRLTDATKTPAYGLVVRYTGPAKEADAGEDAGRTVGQLYYGLAQAKFLADKGRAPLPIAHPSPASAFFVAGAPFLVDNRASNDGFGWMYAGIDTLGLVCGATFGILSINARNQAETGRDTPLKAAQSFLALSYACLATSVLARAVSATHYAVSRP